MVPFIDLEFELNTLYLNYLSLFCVCVCDLMFHVYFIIFPCVSRVHFVSGGACRRMRRMKKICVCREIKCHKRRDSVSFCFLYYQTWYYWVCSLRSRMVHSFVIKATSELFSCLLLGQKMKTHSFVFVFCIICQSYFISCSFFLSWSMIVCVFKKSLSKRVKRRWTGWEKLFILLLRSPPPPPPAPPRTEELRRKKVILKP